MKKFLFAIGLFFLFVTGVSAKDITVYLFHSETCPHCREEREFLQEYTSEHSNVKLKLYEVSNDMGNSELLDKVKESFDCSNSYVPYTVIGEVGLTGFDENRKNEIIHFIEKYQNEEYRDVVSEVIKTGKAVKIDKKEEVEDDSKTKKKHY